MKTINLLTSACRHCRHYVPQGRRGGECQVLGVPVRGSWKACSLATPVFNPNWNEFNQVSDWEPEVLGLEEVLQLTDSMNNANSQMEVAYANSTDSIPCLEVPV